MEEWAVIKDFKGSDCQYIMFQLQMTWCSQFVNRRKTTHDGMLKIDENRLAITISSGELAISKTGNEKHVAETTMSLITRACESSVPQKKIAKTESMYISVYYPCILDLEKCWPQEDYSISDARLLETVKSWMSCKRFSVYEGQKEAPHTQYKK